MDFSVALFMFADTQIAFQDLSHSTVHKLIAEAAVQAANLLIRNNLGGSVFRSRIFSRCSWPLNSNLLISGRPSLPPEPQPAPSSWGEHENPYWVQLLKCVFVLVSFLLCDRRHVCVSGRHAQVTNQLIMKIINGLTDNVETVDCSAVFQRRPFVEPHRSSSVATTLQSQLPSLQNPLVCRSLIPAYCTDYQICVKRSFTSL